MKFTCFHLMPYRPLDLKAAAEHRSAWVVLPNSFYDPKKGAAEYDSYLDQLSYAEKLGFDVIGVNEHHQTAYGMMPAPNLIASALIQRTKTAKIAVLGRALPIVGNPINIAEEFAMLDVLSKGRLIAGFVRGIGAEYHSTGVNPAFSHERFHEAHDLIIKAWAAALQRVPAANAVWAEDRILRFTHSDIGVAVTLEGGLLTPVIRHAETKSLSAISAELTCAWVAWICALAASSCPQLCTTVARA